MYTHTSSLLFLPGTPEPGVVVPVRVSSVDQIELFKYLTVYK